jgi:hypothetical protein
VVNLGWAALLRRRSPAERQLCPTMIGGKFCFDKTVPAI